jgi:NAD(P)-dependent dehydrogenase (short-subunit alcohol dehydrogenase family)
MDRLREKVALMTGSGSGIGRATAKLLAKEGAKVAVVDLNADGGNETVRSIKEAGGEASFFQADLTKGPEVKALLNAVTGSYGRVDVLHSHVGGDLGMNDTVVDVSEGDWDRLMTLNVKTHFLVLKETIPQMIGTGGGSIIITITTNAFVNVRNFETYGATKSTLIQLTKSLAMDYGKDGIRVNAIAPGEVRTPLWEKSFSRAPNPEAAKEALRRKIPLGHIAEPEEIASAVLFLASDDSRYVTGTILFVDGGLTAGFYDFSM